ncbi:NAD-P-binding protein [Armillaria novae-zelandiae]|uniref:NAD-P-binding protein n=1 Tax=Armillaria novae-zelandiae TaxID=153914 RepID=A0AA39PNE6_9AGAR|nr:NAD-P-binding protein [Armillaria novae-zelandiae]
MSARKTVLITGCSTGIGNALAHEFHRQGLVVFATARNEAVLSDLQKAGMNTFALDVTNDEQITRVRDQVASMTEGKLDILVNNAGQSFLSAAIDLDMKTVQDIYDVNVFGAMRMVKAFVPLLIASSDACILQVGSIAALTPYPFGSTYSSSKAALHAYGNALRVELSPFNIKVVNLCTGSVKTDLVEHMLNPLPDDSRYKSLEPVILAKRRAVSQDAITAEQYAKNVVGEALKASPRAWVWYGTKAWIVWALDTFLPRTAFDNMMKGWYGLESSSVVLANLSG